MNEIDLNKIKKVYFVGIKGVAMTALAIIVCEMGKNVTGSDVQEKFPTDKILKKFNIDYFTTFSEKNISQDIDLVIYTGAHDGSQNIEVLTANKKKIMTLSHGEALGFFMKNYSGISVAGSHGKTTASAMIAHILYKANYDPSFAIGCGEILSLNTPAHFGTGKYFVAEADEYVTDPVNDNKPRFLWQFPESLLITNIDFDHPDVYTNINQVQEAFIKFTNNINSSGFVVCNADDINTRNIFSKINRNIITYGTKNNADYILKNVFFKKNETNFQVSQKGKLLGNFILKIPGLHNALNATGVIAVLLTLKVPLEYIKTGLNTFIGTKRRFEFIGQKNGIMFYDDYAHHPVEIAATLNAAKLWFPDKRIIAIFQPHTFSRTLSLLKEFGTCFNDADNIVICDIYRSAREKTISGISGELVYQEVIKFNKSVFYAPKLPDVLKYLKINLRPNDLILTIGAGDIFSWIDEIHQIL